MSGLSKIAPVALAASLVVGAGAANAALLFDQTITPVSGDGDTTFFDEDNDFNESFDFTGLNIATVDEITLTLQVSGARNERDRFINFFREDWSVRAQGSDPSRAVDDAFDTLRNGTRSFTYDASSDGDVFAHTVATQVFTFWLSENTFDFLIVNPSITISSARLQVFGELAPIPVPAALPLLALGLGGLGYAARRQRKARAA